MPHAFISHLREDKDVVDRLAKELRRASIDVWIDRERILPGQRWQVAIRDAIKNGVYFIACFSESYGRRLTTYMNEELTIAIEQLRLMPIERNWFIPVSLDSTEIPDRDIGGGETLRSIQWLDLRQSWVQSVSALIRMMGGNPDKLSESDTRTDPRPSRLSEAENNAWAVALRMDSRYGYQSFLSRFPLSRHAIQAHQAIQIKERNLQDVAMRRANEQARRLNEQLENVWQAALRENSMLAYRDFLDVYPNSKYSSQARIQLSLLESRFKERG